MTDIEKVQDEVHIVQGLLREVLENQIEIMDELDELRKARGVHQMGGGLDGRISRTKSILKNLNIKL